MSRGYGLSSATTHTPHGPVTVDVRVCWVRCDGFGCDAGAAQPSWSVDSCPGVIDDLLQEAELVETTDGKDLCPACRAEGV